MPDRPSAYWAEYRRKRKDPSYVVGQRYPRPWPRDRRNEDLKRRYGIDTEAYQQIHDAQRGLCGICDKPSTLVRRGMLVPLMVDHDHRTGRIRGLVCNGCNRMLEAIDNRDWRRLTTYYQGSA